jgi:hypothetical protein
MNKIETRIAFERIFKELATIEALVSLMPQVQVQVSSRHLPTINALHALGGSGTASSVSKITRRPRANESRNLNDLHGRGLLTKKSQNRSKIFTLRDEKP